MAKYKWWKWKRIKFDEGSSLLNIQWIMSETVEEPTFQPEEGMIYYNAGRNTITYYNGNEWLSINTRDISIV